VSVDQVSADVGAGAVRTSLHRDNRCLSIRSVLTSAPINNSPILALLTGCLSIRSVLTSAPGSFRSTKRPLTVSVDQVSADVGAVCFLAGFDGALCVCRSGQC